MASRSLCVTDTNVWIDLEAAGLIELAFQLPLEFQAPDVIVAELTKPEGKDLVSRGLRERKLTGPEVLNVAALAARHRRPSRVDLFALALARSGGAILLTGDRHLREAAEQEGVEVHGTLWLIDRMVERSLLEPGEAARRLRQARERGRRLPIKQAAPG